MEPKQRAFRPKEELSTEKSKFGLAEIYEREYVEKAVLAAGGDDVNEDGTPAVKTQEQKLLDKKHREIATVFSHLCYKLDALSNFHFTPRPPVAEITVQSDIPALRMEEVIPMAVSSAQAVAAHEQYNSVEQGMPTADTEKQREEKRRTHRAKKRRRKNKRQQEHTELREQARVDPKAAAKLQRLEAQKAVQRGSHRGTTISGGTESRQGTFKQSKAFFTEIQGQVDTGKGRRKSKQNHKTQTQKTGPRSSTLKL